MFKQRYKKKVEKCECYEQEECLLSLAVTLQQISSSRGVNRLTKKPLISCCFNML
jgi:hypothetical protein